MALLVFKLFILLVIANGAPVITQKLTHGRFAIAVDFGRNFFDDRPILGKSKTWRGILSAIVATCLLGLLLGFELYFLVVFALLAMLGDLSTSFIKRRLNYPPSSRAFMLDQMPETLLPMIWACHADDLSYWFAIGLSGLFFVFHLLISPWLFKLKIRRRPY